MLDSASSGVIFWEPPPPDELRHLWTIPKRKTCLNFVNNGVRVLYVVVWPWADVTRWWRARARVSDLWYDAHWFMCDVARAPFVLWRVSSVHLRHWRAIANRSILSLGHARARSSLHYTGTKIFFWRFWKQRRWNWDFKKESFSIILFFATFIAD